MVYQGISWLAATVCLATGLFVLLRHPRRLATYVLSAALIVIGLLTLFHLMALGAPHTSSLWLKLMICCEGGSAVLCYGYAKFAFRDSRPENLGIGFVLTVILALLVLLTAVFVPTESLLFATDFRADKVLFLTRLGFAYYLLLMVFLLFGLVQMERTLAALHSLQRWQVKLEIIAVGLLMLALALYFSQSLLYRALNMNFIHVRSLATLVAVGMLVYSRLSRGEGAHLALSRGIAYRSFVLLIVGGYLILLGLIGQGLRYFQVANYQVIYYFLLLMSALILIWVLLSENLRRRVKVFLHKNFYQSKYDYREQCGRFAKLLSTAASSNEMQVAILGFFCDTFACKGGAFYLLDSETETYLNTAYFNFRRDWRPFTQDDLLIKTLAQKDWIVNLREDASELQGSLVETFREVGAFLVIPLFFDEELTGFIVLGEQLNPDEALTYEDYDLMRLLGRQTIATVQGLRLSDQLSITRELAAIGKVSTFVLHDLKNQVSGLSLMLDNAPEYLEDPDFQQDMLDTVRNTVQAMQSLISRLKNLKDKPQLMIATVQLQTIVDDAVTTAGGAIECQGENLELPADEEEIYKVVLNLLLNAMEASQGELPVQVTYGRREKMAFVEVTDRGCGMSAEFIEEKLFQPFETTKKHGFGIGLYQCKQIVESHQGRISVQSREGEGTRFTILLPLTLQNG